MSQIPVKKNSRLVAWQIIASAYQKYYLCIQCLFKRNLQKQRNETKLS
jgi:hypothetical protein